MKDCISDTILVNDKILLKNSIEVPNSEKIIYEVFRIYDGVPTFVKQHISRFFRSCSLLHFKPSFTEDQLLKNIQNYLESINMIEGNIKIQLYTDNELLFVYAMKYSYPSEEMYANGIQCVFYEGERQNPNAKHTQPLREEVNLLLKNTNAYEAILLDSEMNVTEGSRSNIFFEDKGTFYTSPSSDVLEGVTRKNVMDVCRKLGFSVQTEKISKLDAEHFNSAFLTGTSPKILPVSNISNIKFNVNSTALRKLMQAFNIFVKEQTKAFTFKS